MKFKELVILTSSFFNEKTYCLMLNKVLIYIIYGNIVN